MAATGQTTVSSARHAIRTIRVAQEYVLKNHEIQLAWELRSRGEPNKGFGPKGRAGW